MTCERCGTPALPYGVRAINKDGRTLVLCGHHGQEHHDALHKQGWTVLALAAVETVPSGAAAPVSDDDDGLAGVREPRRPLPDPSHLSAELVSC